LGLQSSDDASTLGGVTSFPCEASRRSPRECLTAWFYEVAEPRRARPKPPEAHLWPRAGGTLGRRHARNGGGNRAVYRGWTRAARPLCPRLPERPRLLRLCRTHPAWPQVFLATPTVLGGIATYGLALIPPMREGRRPPQLGRPGLAHHRGMVGGTRCLRLKQWGWIGAWAWATAQVAEHTFQGLRRPLADQMMVLSDTACHAAEGDPSHRTLCQRGAWQDRLLVETMRSMLTLVCHGQKVMPRGGADVQARLACPMAAFHGLVQWHGFQPYASGLVPLSIAAFRL
jgi:hypothetical protein